MNRLFLLASAVLGTALAGCGGGESSFQPGTPDAVEEVVTLPHEPWSMASDGESLWVQTGERGASRIELESGEVTARAARVEGVSFDGEHLWGASRSRIVELDPRSGRVLRSMPIRGGSAWLAFGAGSVWTYRWNADEATAASVVRIDPQALRIVSETPVSECANARDIEYAFESVWIACKDSEHVVRVVPSANEVVATIPSPGGPHHLAEGAGSLWVTNYRGGTVSRIDPSSNRVAAKIHGVGSGVGIVSTDDAVWAAGANGLVRIDPATNAVGPEIQLLPGMYYYELVQEGDAFWVSVVDKREVWRVALP